MTPRIEDLWSLLRREAVGAQRRIDSTHPFDLYADFEQPDRPGLVLFCDRRPQDANPLKAISIERRQRQDGRWSMRISLQEPQLLAVFAELCRDVVESTRNESDPVRASGLVLSRIERWRDLLQAQPSGLSRSVLRGLIGELLVLQNLVLPECGPDEAVTAWTGPLGARYDFQLPSGLKIEVKALDRDADRVCINGLGQLDGGGDPLELAAVRLEETGREADDALTASRLITRLREQLTDAPAALHNFDVLLRFLGWSEAADTGVVVVRLVRIDRHQVDAAFPRLTSASVPVGIVDASYTVVLPPLRTGP